MADSTRKRGGAKFRMLDVADGQDHSSRSQVYIKLGHRVWGGLVFQGIPKGIAALTQRPRSVGNIAWDGD
jgi:hypothetical protein